MKNSHLLLRCLPAITGLTLLTSAAQAQVTKVGDAYQFRVKYRKGMTIKYVMKIVTVLPTMTAGAKPQSLIMTNPVVGTVTDVQNKIASVKFTSGPTAMNGAPQGAARTIEMKIDDHGKPVGGAPSGMENLIVPLPPKLLKVGESFTSKQDITVAQMPISINEVYTFLGLKSVNGRRAAQFKMTTSGSGSLASPQGATLKFTTKGMGTMGLSVDDGLMTFTNLDQDVIVPQGAQTMKLKTKTTAERQ